MTSLRIRNDVKHRKITSRGGFEARPDEWIFVYVSKRVGCDTSPWR